jgi:hypothetical protein
MLKRVQIENDQFHKQMFKTNKQNFAELKEPKQK